MPQVDLTPDEFAAAVAAVTTAFGDPTRRDKLAGGGYLDVELARHESAGRPSKRYRASADDSHLAFPPRRDDLLATLLARALERLPVEEARQIAEEVGLEYGRAIAKRMEPTEGHRSVKAAVASVADALTAHGFAAHAETRGNALTLVAEHCPFGEAARRYPHVLCAVDTGMVKGMLEGLYGETQPHIEQSRPHGDDNCVTRV